MTKDQMQRAEQWYWAIVAVNPAMTWTLWEFLIDKGFSPDDIWTYSPQIGYDAGQPEPEWV